MPISGHATAQGTARYAARIGDAAAGHFRTVDGMTWSSIGIGTYLGNLDEATDELVASAIVGCLGGGVNVVDSAANYRRERGERSAGAALARAIGEGVVSRDEVVVCTKGGFLPHGAAWFNDTFVADTDSPVGAADLAGNSHCMHPDYLTHQLEQSRRNLGLETIDVYYIHNPESQLGAVDRETFDQRLGAAFRMLEGAVADGRIRAYGLATWNGLRVPPDEKGHLSLARARDLAIAAAREVKGGDHDHFRYVQLPLNLSMPEAVRRRVQIIEKDTQTPLRAARTLGLWPVASGAIGQGRITKLDDKLAAYLGPPGGTIAQAALQFTRSAPDLAAALVGMKEANHVEENLALVKIPVVDEAGFRALLKPKA